MLLYPSASEHKSYCCLQLLPPLKRSINSPNQLCANVAQDQAAHDSPLPPLPRPPLHQVMSVLSSQSTCERASIDEAYLDITEASARRVAAAAAAGGLPDPEHDITGWHLAGQVGGIRQEKM